MWPHANYETVSETLTVVTADGEMGRWWVPIRDNELPLREDLFIRLDEELASRGWSVAGNWLDLENTFSVPVVSAATAVR